MLFRSATGSLLTNPKMREFPLQRARCLLLEHKDHVLNAELKKIRYDKEVKEAKESLRQICAFPAAGNAISASSKSSDTALLECLSKEVPGMECSSAPLHKGGYKITMQTKSPQESYTTSSKVLDVAHQVLRKCGLLLTR